MFVGCSSYNIYIIETTNNKETHEIQLLGSIVYNRTAFITLHAPTSVPENLHHSNKQTVLSF